MPSYRPRLQRARCDNARMTDGRKSKPMDVFTGDPLAVNTDLLIVADIRSTDRIPCGLVGPDEGRDRSRDRIKEFSGKLYEQLSHADLRRRGWRDVSRSSDLDLSGTSPMDRAPASSLPRSDWWHDKRRSPNLVHAPMATLGSHGDDSGDRRRADARRVRLRAATRRPVTIGSTCVR